MTPENMKLVEKWYAALQEAEAVKSVIKAEQDLRKEVIAACFPEAKEGANAVDVGIGWKLKLNYKIDRKVDETTYVDVLSRLRESGVNTDVLVEFKPSLKLTGYRSLGEINKAAQVILEEALTIKPGSHTLELIPPKEKVDAK